MPQVTVSMTIISGLKSACCATIITGAVRYCAADARSTPLCAAEGCESLDARTCAAAHVASAWPNHLERFLFSGWSSLYYSLLVNEGVPIICAE